VSSPLAALGGVCGVRLSPARPPACPRLQCPRLGLPPPSARLSQAPRATPGPCARKLSRCPTGPPRDMVPSQEEPAAERETNEAQPPGPAPSDDAPLPGPGPSDVSDVAAEKVEVELTRSAGSEPPVPPEGGWGWLVMLAAMWCNGSVFGIQNAYGVLFVSMLDTFKAKDDDNMAFKTGGTLLRAEGRRACGVGNGSFWCVLLCWEGVSFEPDPSHLQPAAWGFPLPVLYGTQRQASCRVVPA
jgi:hypothetical protein